jgi:hypothetical protein
VSESAARRGKAGGQDRPGEENDLLNRQFETAEKHSTATLAGWVGHPAVRGVIERHKSEANTAVAPIDRHLPGQKEAAAFSWRLYGLAGIGPDWEPCRRDAPWTLNLIEQTLFEFVTTWFRHIVQVTVSELESAGAGVDSAWAGDYAAVGEMLLVEVPWNLPAAELAASLHPPGPGAIAVGGRRTSYRLDIGERAETNLAAIRRKYVQHLNGPRRRAPYANGGTRTGRHTTADRRKLIAKVLEKFPDVTAPRIVSTFGNYTRLPGGQASSPGGYLRQLLQEAADVGEVPRCPPKNTLRDDLRALRAEKDRETRRVNPPVDSPGHPA